MEPPPGPRPDELGGLRLDLLRRAVDVYLNLAYPSGEIPEVVRRRLVWPEGLARRADADQAAVRARRQDARAADADLRPEARQLPLPAHEDADPDLAELGRLHALGQHPRPGRRPRPGGRGCAGVSRAPGRESAAQGGDRAGLGRRGAPHLPPLPPRLHPESSRGLRPGRAKAPPDGSDRRSTGHAESFIATRRPPASSLRPRRLRGTPGLSVGRGLGRRCRERGRRKAKVEP